MNENETKVADDYSATPEFDSVKVEGQVFTHVPEINAVSLTELEGSGWVSVNTVTDTEAQEKILETQSNLGVVKDKSDRTFTLVSAIAAILLITIISLGGVIIHLSNKIDDLNAQVDTINRETAYSFTGQQVQLDSLSKSVDTVKDDMEEGFNNQQEQIDSIKQVQTNTNSALNRLRKQKEQLEKELEEGLEMRRQKLAESARASYSGRSSGGSFFSDFGGYVGGVYQLTAYEWTGNPCANGNWPTPGYTVASNDYPLGTRLYIEGLGEFVVEDTGGMGSGVIDIYMGDPETCIQFGRQLGNVTVIED